MAYRYADRSQKILFPQSIDEYIPQEAPARAYDVFVDALDFDKLGIQIEPDKVGCPQYDPKVMLKLLVYGYSYGVRSSRKLERETHYNLSFIWLAGGLKPDSQEIYKLRKQKVELPFGHIKHNLKVGGFLLRGLPGVRAEMSILSSCFNIARMISIIGVSGLIARLSC